MALGDLQGRAYTDPSAPSAPGVCDRCSFKYLHSDLQFQYDVRGRQLQNLRILVCSRCIDDPSWQLKTIILPPDPMPIKNPRPGFYAAQEGPPPAPFPPPPSPPSPSYLELEGGGVILIEGGGGIIELE